MLIKLTKSNNQWFEKYRTIKTKQLKVVLLVLSCPAVHSTKMTTNSAPIIPKSLTTACYS